jgi:hypothetical protein
MFSRRQPRPRTQGLGAGLVRCAQCWLVVAVMCPALAMAAPDERLDPVSQLLLERGLIPAESAKQPASASLAQKFRDGAADMGITADVYADVLPETARASALRRAIPPVPSTA